MPRTQVDDNKPDVTLLGPKAAPYLVIHEGDGDPGWSLWHSLYINDSLHWNNRTKAIWETLADLGRPPDPIQWVRVLQKPSGIYVIIPVQYLPKFYELVQEAKEINPDWDGWILKTTEHGQKYVDLTQEILDDIFG